MSTIATKSVGTSPTDDAKQTYESALAQIRHNPTPSYRAPIAVRRRPLMAQPVDPGTEKRALTDAARALARLWNVSPVRVR